jgi:hypothetical protein
MLVTGNGSGYTCYDRRCQRPSAYLCDQDDPLPRCADRVRIRLADVQNGNHGVERIDNGLELGVCVASARVRRMGRKVPRGQSDENNDPD